MTARKSTKPTRAKPALDRPSITPPRPALASVTGAEIIDGAPYFATVEGQRMNRRQWLAATADARKAQLVADLRAEADTDTDPVS